DRDSLTNPQNFRITRFRYLYHEKYGSPRIDEKPVDVISATADTDNQNVLLELAALEPGFIYEFQLDKIISAQGEPLRNSAAYYTLNRLLDGSRFTGPFTQPLESPETASAPLAIDLEAGRKIYHTYCVACHQPDGRGG